MVSLLKKVVNMIKKYESENTTSFSSELTTLLKSKLTIDSPDNNGGNGNGGKVPDLIDLAPLSYSKPDLLAILDDEWFQRTATVVGIVEKKNSRIAAGHLKLFPDRSKEWVLFSPNDSRLPRMKIKLGQCPPGKHSL